MTRVPIAIQRRAPEQRVPFPLDAVVTRPSAEQEGVPRGQVSSYGNPCELHSRVQRTTERCHLDASSLGANKQWFARRA